LDLDTAKMIAHGIVSARLDYCNSLLSGTSGGNFDRLQVVQNALARTVCRASWASSVTKLYIDRFTACSMVTNSSTR